MKTTEAVPSQDRVLSPPADRKLRIIVNPEAGNGRSRKQWPRFAERLAAHGYDYEVYFTDGPGNAATIARQLARDGSGTILAIGGDGTVNEIVNGLIEDGQPVNPETRLAIIPCGTGQDLCRTLGTRSVEMTIRALESGIAVPIDVGRITFQGAASGAPETRYFVNVADAGLGARVASRTNAAPKTLGAVLSYLVQAVKTIAVFEPRDITLWVDDDQAYAGPAHMVVFANGRNHAGGMLFAPSASLTDGLLDIFVLQDVSKLRLLTSILPRVYFGKHVGQRGVLHLRGRRALVESSEELLVEMDGEQPGHAPATIGILPRRLSIVAADGALD